MEHETRMHPSEGSYKVTRYSELGVYITTIKSFEDAPPRCKDLLDLFCNKSCSA